MSKFLTLWLEAPLQAWGVDSRFDARHTLEFPSRSGISGILLAASGDSGPQEKLLAQLADCPLSVFTFQNSAPKLSDFHMVGNGYDSSNPWQRLMTPKTSDGKIPAGTGANPGAKLTYRDYLQDRCFGVIMKFPDPLAEKFIFALQHPKYDLYLGRKCCVPTELIFRGSFPSENEALACLKNLAVMKNRQPCSVIREIGSLADDPSALILPDIPLRFGIHKLYRDRIISKEDFAFTEP